MYYIVFYVVVFWIILFLILEIINSSDYQYILINLFFLIIVLFIYMLYINYSFLVYLLFSVYTSSFLVLCLFLLFFKKHWELTKNFFKNNYVYYIFFFALSSLLFNYDFYYCNSSALKTIFNFLFYDIYLISNLYLSFFDIYALHQFFYNNFFVKSIILNIFFFFAFVLLVFLIIFSRFWHDAHYFNKLLSFKKNIKYLYFFKNVKTNFLNKFKRQVRRSNSSIIKNKK